MKADPDYVRCPKSGKIGYASTQAARRAMVTAGNRVRVYRCRVCGRYHVTDDEKTK